MPPLDLALRLPVGGDALADRPRALGRAV